MTWIPSFAATEYAVLRAGSLTGAKTQVSPWQSACTFDDMSIIRGANYYYWVKARNSGGESGRSSPDQGYSSNAPEMTVSALKSQPNNTTVYVTGGTVSAAFANEFYIQQGVHTSGISVGWSGTVHEGDRVNVLGVISTLPSGERRLVATSVAPAP